MYKYKTVKGFERHLEKIGVNFTTISQNICFLAMYLRMGRVPRVGNNNKLRVGHKKTH
jgi:DNA anti-recombination protein RmuC